MFTILIERLEKDKENYTIVNSSFRNEIKYYIGNTFANLNKYDLNILSLLTGYLIEDITVRYNIDKDDVIKMWTQNNARDIISTCLTLLPFIKDENYSKKCNKLSKLKVSLV